MNDWQQQYEDYNRAMRWTLNLNPDGARKKEIQKDGDFKTRRDITFERLNIRR